MSRSHEAGFSLLEVLVAFSILALSLGVLMQIFSGSLRNADVAHDQAQAVVIAQSLLAAAGVDSPLAAGETTGEVGGKFRWSLLAQPYMDDLAAPVALQPGQARPLDLWEVRVDVRWGEATSVRAFGLSSLRVQAPPLP